MKIIIFITILSNLLFACTGDCLTCHPNLVPNIHKDKRHEPMLTCIKCHSADPNSMAECGSDCFSCHKISKIEGIGVKEHDVIRGCRDCHMKLHDQLQNLDLNPTQSQGHEPLKTFLMGN